MTQKKNPLHWLVRGVLFVAIHCLQYTAEDSDLTLSYTVKCCMASYSPCFQRCDRGRHSAAARAPDGPVGYAGAAARLSPQHHPLHCGDFDSAVYDWNNWSSYIGPGCIPKQVRPATVGFWKLALLQYCSYLSFFCNCRSVWKHFRGLSMCLLLLVFPVFMAYKISQFFHMDFWLLILVSSCMLTSLQVGYYIATRSTLVPN